MIFVFTAWPVAALWAGRSPCPADVVVQVMTSELRSLDQSSDTLRHDDNVPRFVFRFPDAFGDDYRNDRFVAPGPVQLAGALFVFPTRNGSQWTSGDPDLVTLVWPSAADSLPVANQILLSDTMEYSELSPHLFSLDSVWHGNLAQFVFVDLSAYALQLDSAQAFHLGYTAVRNSDDDSLAILSDDGIPETNWASEYCNGSFVLMRSDWRGVNLFIRAVVETPTGLRILDPEPGPHNFALISAYPNPFNSTTLATYEIKSPGYVRLDVFDLVGRLVATPVAGFRYPGTHHVLLVAEDWSSGVYLLRLQSASSRDVLKIILEK
jgi:hypothetical protein